MTAKESKDISILTWEESGSQRSAHFQSESGLALPKKIIIADDTTKADVAFHQAMEGTGLLWRGDFQNAKQLLQALARRFDKTIGKKTGKKSKKAIDRNSAEKTPAEKFHVHRLHQGQRARFLNRLLIPINADGTIPLKRAPDFRQAILETGLVIRTDFVTSLRDLLGMIGAHEWRKKGIPIAQLDGEKIYPYYGVFSPIRGEYLELIQKAELPNLELAFDIGTGTGVISAILAKRGVQKIIATDLDDRALACAAENINHLGYQSRVEVIRTNLFPEGRAPLIICNPPWLPAKPSSSIENAIYDYESQMLRGFLSGLSKHLTENGEGWLILSDLAEHLGLRSREELLNLFEKNQLQVLGRLETTPKHAKVTDQDDPLHLARAKEITSLWRLGHKSGEFFTNKVCS